MATFFFFFFGGGGGGSGPFLPQIWLQFAERQSLNNLSKLSVYAEQDVPKVDGFGPFWGLIYPCKTQNIALKTKFSQKLHPYDYKTTQVPSPR